nr:glycosyltransferase family 4 protein [Paenibacillus sediminis]
MRQKKQIRQKYNVPNHFTVVFAGRLIPRKGIPVLIKAMKEVRKSIPTANLVIAGGAKNSDYKKNLKSLASLYKVPVRFLGNIRTKNMHEVYSLGDCFVCPSQKHEAFGLVIVEALASGLPVIASHIGGIPEIIRHGENGLLVRSYSNFRAFSSQIVRIAKDKGLSRKLSQQGREDVVTRFNWGVTADRLEGIYGRQVHNTVEHEAVRG